MKTYTKRAKEGELLIYEEVLNKISDRYNSGFSILELPKVIEIDPENSVLTLPYYDGEFFNDTWTEATGGSLLGLDLSTEVPMIVYELSRIDISIVTGNPRLKSIPKLIFNTHEYVHEFEKMADALSASGLLTKTEIAAARALVEREFTSPLTLNNGDFYPRNFIRMPDKRIVVVDWETWNANSRANIIDHPENVAAYCFVHMWNNPTWQKKYVQELRKLFSTMAHEDFQRALVIKSLEMASFWSERTEDRQLCANQLEMFRNALDGSYMGSLWSD